jgi:hypothetical protein
MCFPLLLYQCLISALDIENEHFAMSLCTAMISSNVAEDIAPAKDEDKLVHLLESVAALHGSIPSWHANAGLQAKVTQNIMMVWAALWKGNKHGKEVQPGMRLFAHSKLSISLFNLTQTCFWSKPNFLKVAHFKFLGLPSRFMVSAI